jgi:hypothetical protein
MDDFLKICAEEVALEGETGMKHHNWLHLISKVQGTSV